MNIDDLTIGQARELAALVGGGKDSQSHPWKIGACYFIRTVTMAQTGKLVAVHPQELVLVDAAWIADTGRFAQAVKDATFSEVEPFPDGWLVIVGRAAIIDAVEISSLPRSQK
jgi:predicted RNA polymerase sigma factor